MTAVEDPVHRVAGKDVGDLLFGGKHNQRRLEQAGANLRRRLRFRDDDRARRAGLEWVRIGRGVKRARGEHQAQADRDRNRGSHGVRVLSAVSFGYSVSPWAKRAMPSVSPYLAISFARRTRSFGLVEKTA